MKIRKLLAGVLAAGLLVLPATPAMADDYGSIDKYEAIEDGGSAAYVFLDQKGNEVEREGGVPVLLEGQAVSASITGVVGHEYDLWIASTPFIAASGKYENAPLQLSYKVDCAKTGNGVHYAWTAPKGKSFDKAKATAKKFIVKGCSTPTTGGESGGLAQTGSTALLAMGIAFAMAVGGSALIVARRKA